jgi:hypothetical protein
MARGYNQSMLFSSLTNNSLFFVLERCAKKVGRFGFVLQKKVSSKKDRQFDKSASKLKLWSGASSSMRCFGTHYSACFQLQFKFKASLQGIAQGIRMGCSPIWLQIFMANSYTNFLKRQKNNSRRLAYLCSCCRPRNLSLALL